MKTQNRIIDQVDKQLKKFKILEDVVIPPKGWIFSIRKALNMSLRHLGERMTITPQSIREIEEREKNGTVSIKVLRRVGKALNMKLVYGFIPQQDSLKSMIEKRANELAKEIVQRTSISMALEDQKTSDENLEKAIQDKADEIKRKLPKHLWN
ncbi:MAG: mobile mystery protein A [Candidatus Marinimicrobia bacterium]|nr:mobile mystery protein A [Candidatus Neomarinimicrobiota bacterium]